MRLSNTSCYQQVIFSLDLCYDDYDYGVRDNFLQLKKIAKEGTRGPYFSSEETDHQDGGFFYIKDLTPVYKANQTSVFDRCHVCISKSKWANLVETI